VFIILLFAVVDTASIIALILQRKINKQAG